jgi:hypothetical protein
MIDAGLADVAAEARTNMYQGAELPCRVNGTANLGRLPVFAGCTADQLARITSLAQVVGAARGEARSSGWSQPRQ